MDSWCHGSGPRLLSGARDGDHQGALEGVQRPLGQSWGRALCSEHFLSRSLNSLRICVSLQMFVS